MAVVGPYLGHGDPGNRISYFYFIFFVCFAYGGAVPGALKTD